MNQTDLQQIGELLDQKLDQKLDKKFQENNKILEDRFDQKFQENNKILKREILSEMQNKNDILKKEIIEGVCEFIDEHVLPNFDRYPTEYQMKRYADEKSSENKDEIKAHDKRISKLENVVLKKMPAMV